MKVVAADTIIEVGGIRIGAKKGHVASRRAKPVHIDRRQEHSLEICPRCGNQNLSRRSRKRTRIIIDIPQGFNVETFNYHLQTPISEGGLVEMWHRLAKILAPWYEQLKKDALSSAVLHGDETGWRVNGRTHWLWCFGNSDVTYYMIDRSRGSPALNEFFQEFFDGVLITDFWAAYNTVCCADRQMCLVHLLGELKKVAMYKDSSGDWAAFSKKLKRLVHDAVKLWKRREELDQERYARRRKRIELRLRELIETQWDNSQAKRLRKRLDKYEGLFVHVSGQAVCAVRQQSCRTFHQTGSDHAKEQLCESQRQGCSDTKYPDEYLSNAKTAERQPYFNSSTGTKAVHPNRKHTCASPKRKYGT